MLSSKDLPHAPIFKPTLEEFQDFSKYLTSIEKDWKAAGICKIIPPQEWRDMMPFDINKVDKMMIPTPITQYVSGNKGIYQLMLVENKDTQVKDFRKRAEKDKMPRSERHKDEPEDIDRIFWKNIRFNPSVYGADMQGTLQPSDLQIWNMSNLDSILRFLGRSLPGITKPYLYFGMWKAMFAWHVEDMNLFSINYIHHGAPKTWYAIPPEHSHKFERLCQTYFPTDFRNCSEFLRHKTSVVSPALLLEHDIPVTTMTHNEGEIALTYAYAYHSGFNHGFNCAESVNFALESWIPYGLQARTCRCDNDVASINVQDFAKCYKNYKDTGFFFDPSLPLYNPEAPEEHPVSESKTPKKNKRAEEDDDSPKKKMKRISDVEVQMLNQTLEENCFTIPNLQTREVLAAQLGWTAQGVYNWFRRRLLKTAGIESLKERGLTQSATKKLSVVSSSSSTSSMEQQALELEDIQQIENDSELFSDLMDSNNTPSKKLKTNSKKKSKVRSVPTSL